MTLASSSNPNQLVSYQDQFLEILRNISGLQWVRESLSTHSHHYQALEQRHKKETQQRNRLQKQLERQDKEKLSPNQETLDDLDQVLAGLQDQLNSANSVITDLNIEKQKLDRFCNRLHQLYQQIMPDTLQGPYDQMEHLLKEQVDQLATTIPNILTDIKDHSAAQNELYEAREFMETAMMNLPGASTFLDRQAAVGRGSNTRLFNTSNLLQGSSETAIREAEKIAQKAYDCVRKASVECSQVSLIPITVLKKDEKVMAVLTTYRGYRLKIETLLRTRVNPRLNKLESELAINRFRYEQKSIEWVDRQVEMLGSVFWANGCLENIDLQQEISALRMGSSAAIAAIAAQTGGRVTVDDVLEVGLGEPEAHGQLPQYTPSTGDSQMTTLPAYTLDRAPDYQGSDQPPAYC